MAATAPSLTVFLLATLALNISPGPDMLYVISRSLDQGKRAGIVSALGIGAGTLFHTLVTSLGLGAILVTYPLAYSLVRYAGAAYLVYLGVRLLISGNEPKVLTGSSSSANEVDLFAVFRQGVMTNILNPKVALFFLAFLPQFVDQSIGGIPLQLAFLGLLFDASGTSVNMIVASGASGLREFLKAQSGFSYLRKFLPAIILILLGLFVAIR